MIFWGSDEYRVGSHDYLKNKPSDIQGVLAKFFRLRYQCAKAEFQFVGSPMANQSLMSLRGKCCKGQEATGLTLHCFLPGRHGVQSMFHAVQAQENVSDCRLGSALTGYLACARKGMCNAQTLTCKHCALACTAAGYNSMSIQHLYIRYLKGSKGSVEN